MRQQLVTPENGKVWLFHRQQWIAIDDPLLGEDLPVFLASGPRRQNLRRHFCGYALTQWSLGPVFLRPVYSGTLVHVYKHEEAIKARFLVLIEAEISSEILYAQDLPDTIELLCKFAPIILIDILVDIYRRGIATFSRH